MCVCSELEAVGNWARSPAGRMQNGIALFSGSERLDQHRDFTWGVCLWPNTLVLSNSTELWDGPLDFVIAFSGQGERV